MGNDPDPTSRTWAYGFKPWHVVALVVGLSLIVATTVHVLATSVAGDVESISSTDKPLSAPSALVEEFRAKLAPRRATTLELARAASAVSGGVPGGSLVAANLALLPRHPWYPPE